MISTLKRMKQRSDAGASYDEGGPTEVLQEGLAMMQSLINRPELAAVVGRSSARLQELDDELVSLRERLAQHEAADDLDNAQIFSTKGKIWENLRARSDTLFDRTVMLRAESSNNELLAEAKSGCSAVVAKARERAAGWRALQQSADDLAESASLLNNTHTSEGKLVKASLLRKQSAVVDRGEALKKESAQLVSKIARLLSELDTVEKARKETDVEYAHLERGLASSAAAFAAAKLADESTVAKLNSLSVACSMRAEGQADAARFMETAGAALDEGIKARQREFKSSDLETNRKFLGVGAELFEERSMRHKNRAFTLNAKRMDLDARKRDQELAIGREDLTSANRAASAARELAVEIEQLKSEIEGLCAELSQLEGRMEASHETLRQLGAPAPRPLKAVLAAIKLKIVRNEQAMITLEIANARAAKESNLADLEQRLRALTYHGNNLLIDAGEDAGGGAGVAGALVPSDGRGGAGPLRAIWQAIAGFIPGAER